MRRFPSSNTSGDGNNEDSSDVVKLSDDEHEPSKGETLTTLIILLRLRKVF